MQHGQHPRLPPGNDDGGYDNEDIPIIPVLNLGKAVNHFLAAAVSLSAFLLLSSSLSRVAAAAQVNVVIEALLPFPLQMRTMALNKNISNDNVMTSI
jgi:hypothetical protein